MRDTNPMDSAVEGQQQIFAPSPSLQVSRAVLSVPRFWSHTGKRWRGGRSAAVRRGRRVLTVTYSTGSFLLCCCWEEQCVRGQIVQGNCWWEEGVGP